MTTEIDNTFAQYQTLVQSSKDQSGFEDIPAPSAKYTCGNLSHNPPAYMDIPVGKRYKHVCPGCGMVQYVNSSYVYC